jgi:predicted Zn finger-like uncharacterized protein
MIVTCPGCASKYRVRNEAVPAEGARMRCPKCETLFLAKPPAGGATDDGGGEFSAMPQTNAGAPSLAPQQPSLPPSNTRPTAVPGFGAAPAPSPFGPPSNTRPPGFAATGTPFPSSSAPPFGASSAPPFGASQAPPFGASQAPPFGAPASAPFGAPASAPFGAASPFGAPAPSPFGAPPQAAPFSPFGAPQAPSPFAGLPPPSVPTAPKTAGPVTAMMERFDPTAPPPMPPMTSAGDDPFANLDLNAPAPSLASSLPSSSSSSSLPSSSKSPSSSMSSSEIERPRPATQIPRASSLPAPALAQPGRAQQDSFAGAIGSYVALAAAVVAVVGGMTFAGWTSESLDLDDTLMASFENGLGVRPPRSFTGKDDVPLDELRRAATAKESAGDLASAAVLWRRVRARDASDQTARTAEPRVLTALGERLR